MNKDSIKGIISAISAEIAQNRDYLVELDQVNGDGDLGISMDDGYKAVVEYLETAEETDLGKLIMACGKVFNASAPSSLGTITAFGFMGIAKALKGKQEASFEEAAAALKAGVDNIMEKAGSAPGQKTIVDALVPGAEALTANAQNPSAAVEAAAKAAADGSEATRQMKAVHGRAAYSVERSIGILDGGSVVGKLIFQGIKNYYTSTH